MRILLTLVFLLLAGHLQAAILYVRSTDGSDADTGATWALAKATLAGAFTASAAGDTIYVSQVHAETQASAMTLTPTGTAASPNRVICVNDGAEPPTAVAATATISVTGSFAMGFVNGTIYYEGIIFNIGSGSTSINAQLNITSAGSWFYHFNHCSFRILGTGGSQAINFGAINAGSNAERVVLEDCTFSFAATGQGIVVACPVFWRDTASALLGTIPTNLLKVPTDGNAGYMEIIGVDLSASGSGKNLIDLSQPNHNVFFIQDSKLGASVTVGSGSVNSQGATEVTLINSDSADTNYRYLKQTYQGSITQEIIIVRTGGASDGTTPVSRKMVTTAGATYFSPLEADPVVFWNETLASMTVKIAVVTDNVTLTDAEAWIRVEYLGTSGFPKAEFARDRSATILTTPANQTTDSTSTWTTTGLTTPVKQELSVTFTPAEKGPIRVRVMLAKASTTMYFDPLAIVQ